MLKKIFMLIILILLSIDSKIVAFAHSYIKESKPSEAEIVKEPIDMIDITFETKIETIGELFLTYNNQTIEVKNITIEEDKLIGQLDKPLSNGQYKAIWKIVGEDGHPLEGTISFTVQVPNQYQNESSNKVVETEKQTEDPEQPALEQKKNDNNLSRNEKVNQIGSSTIKKWFLPLASLTILIMAFFLFRKDKK